MIPNRTLCSVLEEMRKANETRNYSYLTGLIEEAQSLGNRMEAALWNQKDYNSLLDKISDLKKELKSLKAEKKELTGEKDNSHPNAIPIEDWK